VEEEAVAVNLPFLVGLLHIADEEIQVQGGKNSLPSVTQGVGTSTRADTDAQP
jgi:hypothetical protein